MCVEWLDMAGVRFPEWQMQICLWQGFLSLTLLLMGSRIRRHMKPDLNTSLEQTPLQPQVVLHCHHTAKKDCDQWSSGATALDFERLHFGWFTHGAFLVTLWFEPNGCYSILYCLSFALTLCFQLFFRYGSAVFLESISEWFSHFPLLCCWDYRHTPPCPVLDHGGFLLSLFCLEV
jgi:hypothetical protein